jgi:polysaccharide export outer membrane protein
MKRLMLLLLLTVGLVQGQSIIEPGRAIDIRIQGVPSEEMSRVNNTYPVSESGVIRMPFIGDVKAAGLNPNTLAKRIEASYRNAKIYTNPTVQVFASSDETKLQYMVTIGGYVRSPGPVPYQRGLTLYRAVQSAGGATEFGSRKRVQLIRDGEIRVYNLNETAAKAVELKPNDAIEVPQKNIFGQ